MSRPFNLNLNHWLALDEPYLDWEVILLALFLGLLLGL